MKKISKLLALAAGVAVLFFAGCSDLGDTSGTVAQGAEKSASSDKEYGIQLYAEDGAALDLTKWGVQANRVSADGRTIVADGLGDDLENDTKVTFWLYGTNQLNASDTSIANPKNVAFALDASSNTTGKVTLGLSASRWNLTLVACDASKVAKTATPTATEVKAAAYYIGYANVDLRSATTLKFYLSADGLTGTGGAKLTFRFDGMDDATEPGTWSLAHAKTILANNYTITADITSRLQNITSSPQDIDPTKFLPATPAAAQASTAAAGSVCTWSSVAPGTYNLEVKFTCPASDDDLVKSYVWSDIIIILPNQTIVKDIDVPDVVLYKPDSPATFQVGYVTPTSTATNTYNAVLAWTDSSNNETYFEVQYTNLAGTTKALTTAITTDTDDEAWTAATNSLDDGNTVKLGETFYGNTNLGWVAGSLVKNNKAAVVKLSLGTRYLFRIAAVNDAGHSDWTYATYDLTTAQTGLSTGASTANFAPSAYSIYEIDSTDKTYKAIADTYAICANLYRLTYHLNGGTYYYKDTTGVTADQVFYLSQKPEPTATTAITTDDTTGVITDGIPILTPDGEADTPTYSYLIKNSNLWTSWRKYGVEGKIYQNAATDYPSYAAEDPQKVTKNGTDRYLPDGYLGYKNLDLFASYTIGSAQVEVYSDITYDFKDGELSITGVTPVNDKAYTFTYTSSTSSTALTLAYAQETADTTDANAHQAAFKYDNVTYKIVNVATNDVVAVGTLDPSTNSSGFDIAPFGDGKFTINVCGEYKGHQYSYVIILEIVSQ